MTKAEKITEMIEERRLDRLPFLRKMRRQIEANSRLSTRDKRQLLRKNREATEKMEAELRELESEAAAISGGVN